jgi:hypothetical protein
MHSVNTHSIDISFIFHSYFIRILCGKEELSISVLKTAEIRNRDTGINTKGTCIKCQVSR